MHTLSSSSSAGTRVIVSILFAAELALKSEFAAPIDPGWLNPNYAKSIPSTGLQVRRQGLSKPMPALAFYRSKGIGPGSKA